MNRRKLLGTITGVLGGSLAFGTGAFSSSRADRSITAEVVDDSEAYLQIDTDVGIAGRSSDIDIGYDGKVATFRIPGPEDHLVAGTDPTGVGTESEYWFTNMAIIRNQGTQPITVYSEYDGAFNQIAIYESSDRSTLLTSHETGYKLDVGEEFPMGIYLNVGEQDVDEYHESIAIIGEAD